MEIERDVEIAPFSLYHLHSLPFEPLNIWLKVFIPPFLCWYFFDFFSCFINDIGFQHFCCVFLDRNVLVDWCFKYYCWPPCVHPLRYNMYITSGVFWLRFQEISSVPLSPSLYLSLCLCVCGIFVVEHCWFFASPKGTESQWLVGLVSVLKRLRTFIDFI